MELRWLRSPSGLRLVIIPLGRTQTPMPEELIDQLLGQQHDDGGWSLSSVTLLRDYLKDGLQRQDLHNRVWGLWASTKVEAIEIGVKS